MGPENRLRRIANYLIDESPSISAGIVAIITQQLVGGPLHYLEKLHQHPTELLPWFVTGAAVYTISTITDIISSMRVAKNVEEANKLGVAHSYHESNPFMSDQPTVREFLSRRKILLEIAVLTTVSYPPLPLGIGVSRSLAALRNEFVVNKTLKRLIKEKKDLMNKD